MRSKGIRLRKGTRITATQRKVLRWMLDGDGTAVFGVGQKRIDCGVFWNTTTRYVAGPVELLRFLRDIQWAIRYLDQTPYGARYTLTDRGREKA